VGRASAVLGLRAAAAGLLGALLGLYYAFHESLPDTSTWGDVAVIALVLMPAVFALVCLALPLARARWVELLGLAVATTVLAILLRLAGADTLSDFAKLGAVTAAAFCFLYFFEDVSWVVLVACIIPWVDAYSVWRGPTNNIVHHHGHVFNWLAFAFPLPGEDNEARLGIPDLLFFALFLAASARFRLRPWLTWALLVLSFGATISIAVVWNRSGLPALPLLSAAFLLANADLIWRALRRKRRPA
jgi:hypothetical protein